MLQQLSLEDNQVESLQGIQCLSTLMELYMGNNCLSDLKEVRPRPRP